MKFFKNLGSKDEKIEDQEAMDLLTETYGYGATHAFLHLAMEGGGAIVINGGILKCRYESA